MKKDETLSKPMLDALREIKRQTDPETGIARRLWCVTPGTLRALERRGLIRCSAMYATDDVRMTDAGRAAAAKDN